MKLSSIINKSVAAFSASITENKDVLKYIEYFRYNQLWLASFDNIVLSLAGDKKFSEMFVELLNELYIDTNLVLLYSEYSEEYLLDNDRKIFEYAYDNQSYEYIWKFSIGVIADQSFLDIEIDNSDLFFINNLSCSYPITDKEDLLKQILNREYFNPEPNYYIVKNKIQNFDYSDEMNHIDTLKKIVKNYNLSCHDLLSKEDNKKMIDLIFDYKINDGSHKNIVYSNVGNLCYFYYIGHPVAEI